MERRSPAFDRALSWLDTEPQGSDARRTLDSMARHAGVSRATMWKAVCHRQGRTTSRPAQVKSAIARDMNRGFYGRGEPLPQQKILAERYGAGKATVVEALRMLMDDGLVVRRKKGYSVSGAPQSSAYGSTIVCITPFTSPVPFRHGTPWSQEFWRTVEHECTRRSLRVEFHSTHDIVETAGRRDRAGRSFRSVVERSQVIGALYWTLSTSVDELRSLFGLFATTGTAVGALYETDFGRLQEALDRSPFNPRLRVFTLSTGQTCAHDMAMHLWGRGHRKVAFFSDCADSVRAREMNDAFTAAGLSEQVVHPYPKAFANQHEYTRARDGSGRVKAIEKHLKRLRELAGLQGSAFRDVYRPIRTAIDLPFVRSCMQPLFREALADPSITAWVGQDDSIALFALEFLRRETKGSGIAVAGFDDSMEAFKAGLTSYSFNPRACATDLVEYLAFPSHSRVRHSSTIVRIPGSVVQRASTEGEPAVHR